MALYPFDKFTSNKKIPVIMLAPMAGVTDRAYRSICKDFGADLTYSEMISSVAVSYKNRHTWNLVQPDKTESQLAIQLFGHDVEMLKFGSMLIREKLGSRLALFDINMACPVRKILKNGDGAAMMNHVDKAQRIVDTLKNEHPDVPITVKMRIGLTRGDSLGVAFAKKLEAAGADSLTVHGRYADQLYRGESSNKEIARIVDEVNIPIIGSGDIFTANDALKMIEETKVNGVMVARGSYGNPWIFQEIKCALHNGTFREPTISERLDVLREHVKRHELNNGHMPRLRKVVGWYVKGIPLASVWRKQAMQASTKDEFLSVIDQIEMCALTYKSE